MVKGSTVISIAAIFLFLLISLIVPQIGRTQIISALITLASFDILILITSQMQTRAYIYSLNILFSVITTVLYLVCFFIPGDIENNWGLITIGVSVFIEFLLLVAAKAISR